MPCTPWLQLETPWQPYSLRGSPTHIPQSTGSDAAAAAATPPDAAPVTRHDGDAGITARPADLPVAGVRPKPGTAEATTTIDPLPMPVTTWRESDQDGDSQKRGAPLGGADMMAARESVRRGSVLERVIDNCWRLNAYCAERGIVRSKMWTVLQRANVGQMPDLVRLAAELGDEAVDRHRRVDDELRERQGENTEIGGSMAREKKW